MKRNLKKLLGYYKPYKLLFFSDLLFAVIGAVISLVIPLIVRYITNEVVYLDYGQATKTILMLALVMIALVAIAAACNYFMVYYGHMMGTYMEADMRRDLFQHYQKLSFTFYDNQKVGSLLSRVTSDLFDITELLHHGPEDIFISIIKFVGALAILLSIDVPLTLITFAFIPLMLLYGFFCNRKMKQAFKLRRQRIGEINGQIEDSLSGIRVVKSFANEECELEKFRQGNEGFVEAKRMSYRHMANYFSVLDSLTTLMTVAVLVGGVFFMTKGSLQVTDLLTFMLYISNFTEPVRKLINFTEMFQSGYSGFERFMEIMDVEPDIQDKKGALAVSNLKGDMVFDDVSFHYEDAKEQVLNHVQLEVAAGEYLALVGASGVGKTTLCSLIPRFYEVSEGAIRIDGIDIRDMKMKDLRSQIGIVQQDVYLFAGTILENIRYGRPNATDEEVVEAAKRANAHEFIMGFPDGYASDIGQRGVKLSGGQKQRISIARVFLKNPPILIFDEATSALDNESELVVQQSLEKLAKDRTTFVIAHRLSTIRNAQRILVLTENGIEEEGTHEELIAKDGVYAALYQVQFR
ncbi:MAG: ABC transporter ATP-binding protein [Faecalimonas sp.]|nr:ABC transporter ATP-binding protein [Faecalimonas sp.]